MTKDRATLDEIERKLGTKDVGTDEVEKALRALARDPSGQGQAFVNADNVVDRLDVHDRANARESLFTEAAKLLRGHFHAEAEGKAFSTKGEKRKCVGIRGWSFCSRPARVGIKLDLGTGTGCFQHDEANVYGAYASQELRKVLGDDRASQILGFKEAHEAQPARVFGKEFEVVTVSQIWDRLRERVEKVDKALPDDGTHREQFDEAVSAFVGTWGAI